MTRIGISVTMATPFRNSVQEFSNVIYYDGLLGDPSTTEAENLIDEFANRLKAIHSLNVSFLRGRLWRQTSDKSTTEMLAQKNLSGTGAMTPVSGMDKERAYLFRLRAGVDSRGNPVYFRKWIHADAQLGGITTTGGIQGNTTGFSTAQRSTLAALMAPFGTCGSASTLGTICSKNGRTASAGANWEAHQFLEHHQLGDQWRAQ